MQYAVFIIAAGVLATLAALAARREQPLKWFAVAAAKTFGVLLCAWMLRGLLRPDTLGVTGPMPCAA